MYFLVIASPPLTIESSNFKLRLQVQSSHNVESTEQPCDPKAKVKNQIMYSLANASPP